MRYIALGVVTKPFGIRGEVRVRPYNPSTTWFEEAEGVWLREREGAEPTYIKIIRARRHQEFFLLSLEGVRDANAAEGLRGLETVVPEDQLPTLPEGEYYWHQLIGLKVETANGRQLGEVLRIEETAPLLGGNDNLVAKGDRGEFMIALAEDSIEKVDLAAGKIIVAGEAVSKE